MKPEIPPDPFAGWPPVIDSASIPRAVKLRDLVLTLMMWVVMLLIVATEIEAAWEAFEVLRGRSDAQINAELAEFARKMRPLMVLVAVLVAGLSAATFRSWKRRERALNASQPDPLDPAILAERAGLLLSDIEYARTHRIATVHRRAANTVSVLPKE